MFSLLVAFTGIKQEPNSFIMPMKLEKELAAEILVAWLLGLGLVPGARSKGGAVMTPL